MPQGLREQSSSSGCSMVLKAYRAVRALQSAAFPQQQRVAPLHLHTTTWHQHSEGRPCCSLKKGVQAS